MATFPASHMHLVGSLSYGQYVTVVYGQNSHWYPAFSFGGQKGDRVTISVSSTDGDAVAWLLDHQHKELAKNDDANSMTLDSLIHMTLPGNSDPNILTYYIVFRDYGFQQAHFTVRLNRQFGWPVMNVLPPARPPKARFPLQF